MLGRCEKKSSALSSKLDELKRHRIFYIWWNRVFWQVNPWIALGRENNGWDATSHRYREDQRFEKTTTIYILVSFGAVYGNPPSELFL